MTQERTCATCGGTEFLQEGWGKGGLNDVCRPCFGIWYDGPVDSTNPAAIGEYSRKAKAEGLWPWSCPQFAAGA